MTAFIKKFSLLLFSCFFLSPFGYSQYQDYIGAGHDQGIKITASSEEWNQFAQNTINGSGMDAERMEAGRFLNQATFGSQKEDIDKVLEMGYEDWIFDQIVRVKPVYTTQTTEAVWSIIRQWKLDAGELEEEIGGPNWLHFHYAWWQNVLSSEDQLRQRMAYALSQILVVSMNSDLSDMASSLTTYYDLLIKHAFGNYEDLLLDVSLSLSMGYYLSHLDNPKADPDRNIHPDENYAREIMQLFSIGLYELNIDGTRKLDANGNPIPTYENEDIKELAKVFTGLGAGGIEEFVDWTNEPYFGLGLYASDKSVPMVMYEEYHEPGPKTLLGGLELPAGQSGMQDIEDAVNNLFNHPNVGPFIGRQLIQRLVKSNPSPDYIARVAMVFNDNGEGVRGDLGAVVKAILLDPETRECESYLTVSNGKLSEPVLRYAQVSRSLDKENKYNRFWDSGYGYLEATSQMVLNSPTVFNFYTPDFQPVGRISEADLVAPEFKIHNSKTSMGYINSVNSWVVWNSLMYHWEGEYTDDPQVRLVTTEYEDIVLDDPEEVLNQLDILFTNGKLTDDNRRAIRAAMDGLEWGNVAYDRVRMAIYLLLITPDYNILR